jgi:hypothetical protein
MRFIGILWVIAGCDFRSAAGPDAPGEPRHDAQPRLGMFVTWGASPMLPGALTDKLVVSSATFQLDHFQIVADAGGVMRSNYLLAWDQEAVPQPDAFPDAPPGLYSKIALAMTGGNFGDYSYRIRGTWGDGGPPKPYEIRDQAPLSISFDCDEVLAAAGSATIAIKVDLRDAISGIDFTNVNEEDGVLELDEGAELLGFRSRLQDAFKLDN